MLRTILRPFRRLTYVGLFMNPFASRRVRDSQRRRARGWGSDGGAFGLGLLSFSGRGVESLEQRQLLAFTTDLNPIPVPSMGSLLSDGAVVIAAVDAAPRSGDVDSSGLFSSAAGSQQAGLAQDSSIDQFTVVGGGLLDAGAQAAWNDAVARVNSLLSALPGRSDYPLIMNEVFGRAGTDVDSFLGRREHLASQLQSTGLGITVELRPGGVLNGNRGAFTAAAPGGGERIYINADWAATASADDIAAVLLEEIGHGIDQRLNPGLDSAGDEGELFSDVVRSIQLSDSELAAIESEDDHGLLTVDGTGVAVEFASTTVSSVTIPSSPDGYYTIGENVDFTVTFSGNETVFGTPQLTVAVGANNRAASYISGSGTSTLTFRYTIVSGDSDTDGISIAANQLATNGGAIFNGATGATLGFNAVSANANAKVLNVNRPTLTTMSTFTGATEDTAFVILYSDLTFNGNDANSD